MRKLLLDTHILLWAATDAAQLPEEMRNAIQGAATVSFSSINLWEVAIKASLRKDFVADIAIIQRYALSAGYTEVPVRGDHVQQLASLPALHKDPFDRMLLAQAQTENLELLTKDRAILSYGTPATSS